MPVISFLFVDGFAGQVSCSNSTMNSIKIFCLVIRLVIMGDNIEVVGMG